jgi:hypothetical protein
MAITVNSDLQLIQADKQFIDLVSNRITMYGQIPYSVPQKLIIDIIKESSRFFFKNNYRANQKKLYHLLKSDIATELGVSDLTLSGWSNFTVKLPSFVQVVEEIYECNGNSVSSAQELLENIQLLQRNAPYGQTLMGINANLYILEAGVRMIEQQNYRSIFGTSVAFSYNPLTHILNIRQELTTNLMLDLHVNVDIQILYNDDLFIRHVIGRTKQELKRVLAGHTFELPGGVTLSADEICNNLEDIEKVEDIIKNSGGIGDIILCR